MTSEKENMESNNENVVCGGTFDHFHNGHRDFLTSVISQGHKAVIGVTSDDFAARSKDDSIESYETRKKSVEEFLKSKGRKNDEIVVIHDLFGPTLDSKYFISKLVVSELTQKGAEIINQKRKEKGFPKLSVVVVSLTKAEDGNVISSTRIRNGEIDREGKLTINPSWLNQDRNLPESLRSDLSRAQGPFIENLDEWIKVHDSAQTVVVGDVVTETFNVKKFGQILSVVDFHVARKQRHTSIDKLGFNEGIKIVKIANPAATLTPSIFNEINEFFCNQNRSRSVFVIDGEEDLVVLPLLLRAPLGFNIIYGQPNKGMVSIFVDEQIKKLSYSIVSKFTI